MNYQQLLKTVLETGKEISPHGRPVKELMHMRLDLPPLENLYSFGEVRPKKKIMEYFWKELAWYMSGERSNCSYIAKYAGLWDKIKNPDGSLNSCYGYLVFYHSTPHPSLGVVTLTPFEWALECLRADIDSRQAVITYNNGGYNYPGNGDYICTQHQAFYIRDNRLLCFIALRSSDLIWGLSYNIPWWDMVKQNLYLKLLDRYPNLNLGPTEVDIYSAHIYSQHYDLVKRMVEAPYEASYLRVMQPFPLGLLLSNYEAVLPAIVEDQSHVLQNT